MDISDQMSVRVKEGIIINYKTLFIDESVWVHHYKHPIQDALLTPYDRPSQRTTK